jgi:hypothetical protein
MLLRYAKYPVARLDRQAARLLTARHGAEVARAQKDAELIIVVRPIDRSVLAKPGEPDVVIGNYAGHRAYRRHLAHIEQIGIVADEIGVTVNNLKNLDAIGVVKTAMKEYHLARQFFAAPQGTVRFVSDRAISPASGRVPGPWTRQMCWSRDLEKSRRWPVRHESIRICGRLSGCANDNSPGPLKPTRHGPHTS